MASADPQLIVTVNGPGEISGWLFPFSTVLKRRAPTVRLCVAILPCVFASGAEDSVVKALATVDSVAGAAETVRYLYGGPPIVGFEQGRPGALLHLGGEPLLSYLLARRFRYTSMAYLESVSSVRPWFRKVYLTDEGALAGRAANGRLRVIGNMIVDAALLRVPRRRTARSERPTIGFLPGSRARMVKSALPFYIKIAGLAAPALPRARWLVAKADYVTPDDMKRAAMEEEGRVAEGESARWEPAEPFGRLISPRGVRLEIQSAETVMAEADLVVTIPGTNTAELAVLGVPMLVLSPVYYAQYSPFPGLIGHLDALPYVGRRLKGSLIKLAMRRVRYLALPNRKQQRAVVPEMFGYFTAAQVAGRLVETAHGPLDRMAQELRVAMGPPGAAERLVDEVLAFVGR
jgi:lipid-A-disaccharide synthase